MDAATSRSLVDGAQVLGVNLDSMAIDRLHRYFALLEKWNAQINLTRVTAPKEVVSKHFLDSLSVAAHVADANTLIDVGSGGGFPGAVLACAYPRLRLIVIESNHKKAAFLEALKRELTLSIDVCAIRLEDFQGGLAEIAVSRATFAPPEWIVRGSRLVQPGGKLIAMLGKERPMLVAPGGFAGPELVPYQLPTEGDRALAIFRKI